MREKFLIIKQEKQEWGWYDVGFWSKKRQEFWSWQCRKQFNSKETVEGALKKIKRLEAHRCHSYPFRLIIRSIRADKPYKDYQRKYW